MANFIREMISEPVLTHDDYADSQHEKLMMSKRIASQVKIHDKLETSRNVIKKSKTVGLRD